MGCDLYGENPKMNSKPGDFPVYSKYIEMDWNKKEEDFNKDSKLQDKYFEEMSEYEEANPGFYFRNNCWWWRPLWHFVCNECDDILTEEDMDKGSYNDCHLIDKEKAIAIADRLDKMNKAGVIDEYAVGFETQRLQAKEDNKGKKCSDDGYDWSESYPFDADNVREFAKFCRDSGGFTIG